MYYDMITMMTQPAGSQSLRGNYDLTHNTKCKALDVEILDGLPLCHKSNNVNIDAQFKI